MQPIGLYVPVTTQRQVPAVPLRGRAPDQFIDRVVNFLVVLRATCIHSANCAADRCAVLGLVVDVLVIVPPGAQSRLSRSSTSLL